MTEKLKAYLHQLKSKEYRQWRSPDPDAPPLLYPVDYFGFNFGTSAPIKNLHCDNFTIDYPTLLSQGLEGIAHRIRAARQRYPQAERQAFADEMLTKLQRMLQVADAHREAVREENPTLYEALRAVPRHPARSFYEACVCIRAVTYFLRIGGVGHLGLGRFDQYMYPYWQGDLAKGVSEDTLTEILQAFFIATNYDGDIYTGVQQGDNGQSLVLGGFDPDGTDRYNALSQKCMEASLTLNLIDPKINLRVGKNTPQERLVFATRLTAKGLGFPQYCNDDVVVPGLIKRGYRPEDAHNYVVAACWEFIIPGVGADIPNIRTMDYPRLVRQAMDAHLRQCATFEALMSAVEAAIAEQCEEFIRTINWRPYSPAASLFVGDCADTLRDMYHGGARYFNYGCHGAGLANAADALEAVRVCVYEEKSVTPDELLAALEADFEGYEALRHRLRACPKMGNNVDTVDAIAGRLMGAFGDALNDRQGPGGHRWRAGTGSAQEYYYSARNCPATADGRKSGDMYSCSFSPSLDVKTDGVLSVLQSFTKFDLTRVINGGPLTLELHHSVLRNPTGIEKTARLVRLFIELGGHQLQLNAIDAATLRDAQQHPEAHPDLIVRVWGWSGYFNELEPPFQEHIIRRTNHTL